MANYMTEFSPDNDSHIYRVKDPEAIMPDVIGWTGKNIMPYPNRGTRQMLASDGTITDNSDAYLTDYVDIHDTKKLYFRANTVTGNVYLRIGYYNSSKQFISRALRTLASATTGSEDVPTNTVYMRVCIEDNSSNKVADFMMWKDYVVDNSYEPYHDSVDYVKANREEVKDVIGWSGKNLLKAPLCETRSYSGGGTITVTRNGDNELTEIDINGTFSSATYYQIYEKNTGMTLPADGKYILSGSGITQDVNAYLMAIDKNNATMADLSGGKKEAVFTYDSSKANMGVFIAINANTSHTHTKIYPMIRKASIADGTFEPYHKSVKDTLRDAEVIEGKNLLDKRTVQKSKASMTVTPTSNGVRVQVSNEGWANAYFDFDDLPTNTNFIVSDYANITSGNLIKQNIQGSNDGTTYTDIANSSTITSSASQSTSFNTGSYKYIRIRLYITGGTAAAGDVTFENLMLRLATETDATYEPYYIPLKDSMFPREEQRVLGAKNLFNLDGAVVQDGGLTYTKSSDSITINAGTATGEFLFPTSNSRELVCNPQRNLEYIFSVGDVDLSNTGITLQAYYYVGSGSWTELVSKPNVNQIRFTVPSDADGVWVRVRANRVTLSANKTLYPMLRLASDPDDTYVPYAMTNRELTDAVTVQESAVTTNYTVYSDIGNHLYKSGKCVQMIFGLESVSANSGDTIATIPSGYRPKTYGMYVVGATGGMIRISIHPNGAVKLSENVSNKNLQLALCWITD